MVTFKKVNKQKLCDDLMVENLKQAQRIATLEAMVASLRINQQTKVAIEALFDAWCRDVKPDYVTYHVVGDYVRWMLQQATVG